jgi:hypothetical protein
MLTVAADLIGTAIGHLLCSGGPAAVIRLIVTIVVNPIYFVAIRAHAHIRKKVFKRSAPTLANLDTPAPIIGVRVTLEIVAALLDRAPRAVRPCVGHAVSDWSFISHVIIE